MSVGRERTFVVRFSLFQSLTSSRPHQAATNETSASYDYFYNNSIQSMQVGGYFARSYRPKTHYYRIAIDNHRLSLNLPIYRLVIIEPIENHTNYKGDADLLNYYMTRSFGYVIITHRSSSSYSACSSCRSSIWKNFSALNQTGLGVLNPASPANRRDPALQGQGSLWSWELESIEESYI